MMEREVRQVDDGRGGLERWVCDARLPERSRLNGEKPDGRRVVLNLRCRCDASGWVFKDQRQIQGRDHQRQREPEQRGGGIGVVFAPGNQ